MHAYFIYDQDCSFCSSFVNLARRVSRSDLLQFVPADSWIEDTDVDLTQTALFIKNGVSYTENQAIAGVLRELRFPISLLGRILQLRIFDWLGHQVYHFISTHRKQLGCKL
ncbi:thiol-disulfide oxidoreductase DCC family protein [Corynebacterium caspium]|uniref:thiol-disulfide oxidoreductase DCC family protein n=1 Tax=Corynebacterium caspium TaxID=234828 RepID=UPI00037DB266|nr:DCC1-like thiol-disulfide oxidoreductase family protein [Corynebacterium caspium]WKD59949.1 hypothetical protein CCASP_07870 [Corynebacterium caspium DSM 44850]